MGRIRSEYRSRRRIEAQEVRARDVPLSFGRHPHGARAQLHDRRRDSSLLEDARLRCASPHGVGCFRSAGRERRHQAPQPPCEVDVREHRDAEGVLQAHGPVLRLGPHGRCVRPRVLSLGPVDLLAVLEARACRAPRVSGELVPQLQDRSRKRAGHGRRMLALPRRCREARPHAVVFQDHRLRAGAARRPRPARRLARAREADAGELDRPFGRRRGRLRAPSRRGQRRRPDDHRVHDAPRHALRMQLLLAGP